MYNTSRMQDLKKLEQRHVNQNEEYLEDRKQVTSDTCLLWCRQTYCLNSYVLCANNHCNNLPGISTASFCNLIHIELKPSNS